MAEVLELAGGTAEARSFYEQALESFERKGSLPDIERMRLRLEQLE